MNDEAELLEVVCISPQSHDPISSPEPHLLQVENKLGNRL